MVTCRRPILHHIPPLDWQLAGRLAGLRKDDPMKKTTLLMAASSAFALAYAVAVTHVPAADASDAVACGDSDAKKKKSDKKNEDNS